MLGVVLMAPCGTDYTPVLQTVYGVPKRKTRHIEARWFVLASFMSRDPMAYGAHWLCH